MKLTNTSALPKALFNALSKDSHKHADYSASQLTKPAQALWLESRHDSEITRDVSDMIWMLFGTAVHSIIEKAEHPDQLIEEYMTAVLAGKTISGACDVYDNEVVQDWKTTSVWSYIFLDDDKIHDYESQLNTYAYLFRQQGFRVKALEIIMLFRDWQASKAKYDPKYPQSQIHKLPIKLWTEDEQRDYITARIDYYEGFRDTEDIDLPECTPSERWVKPSTFAVMKTGRKSAVRVLDTESSALSYIESNGLDKKHYVEERKADQWKRCEYCNAKDFCNQWRTSHE